MIKEIGIFLIAVILCLILLPFGFIYTIIGIVLFQNRKGARIGLYYRYMAIGLDQLGNIVCAYPMNCFFIKKGNCMDFGNPDETISSVIGKNKKAGNLRTAGKSLDWILNKMEREHSIKWIEEPKPVKEF